MRNDAMRRVSIGLWIMAALVWLLAVSVASGDGPQIAQAGEPQVEQMAQRGQPQIAQMGAEGERPLYRPVQLTCPPGGNWDGMCPPGYGSPGGGLQGGGAPGGGVPETRPVDPPQYDAPQRDEGASRATRAHPAVCRVEVQGSGGRAVAYGSGTLVDVEGRYGLVVSAQHVFRGGGDRVVCHFPGGQKVAGRKTTIDKHGWDVAAILVERPEGIDPVDVATETPPVGSRLWISGYGGSGQYLAQRGNLAGKSGDAGSMRIVGAPARQGDSGGPVLDERGRLVGVLWGTDGRNTVATYSPTADEFLVRAGRYLLPWNSETERERERQRGETERERIRNDGRNQPPYYPPPSQPSGPDPQLAAKVAALERDLSDLKNTLQRVRDELPSDLKDRVDAALSRAELAADVAGDTDREIDTAKRDIDEQRSLIDRLRQDVVNIGDGKIAGVINTEDAAAIARRVIDERVPDEIKARVKDSLPWWVGPGVTAALALGSGGGIGGAMAAVGSAAARRRVDSVLDKVRGDK